MNDSPTLPLRPLPEAGLGLLGRTVSHYRVLERLGGGSMGVVYRAEDLRLGRSVALKFLPRELTRDGEARERFLREARAASSLDHPNVCTIHEIDETDEGRFFIAMACYDGETLKEKIRRGPLGVGEAVRVGLAVADGLAGAHQAGIVHRDVKPANIFVTNDGQVKILDFGLAKLAGRDGVSEKGMLIGTVNYMSPEQAQGREVDHGADIWGFGVVLYEMLTGRLPFRGHNEHAVIYAILNDEPPPPTDLIGEAPRALEKILARALQKDPRLRYRSMRDLITDLRQPLHETSVRAERERSVAVLPFANMCGDPDHDYFCDGMAEELINALSHVAGLRVLARTSSFAFRGRSMDVRQIGRLLDVETLLEGSVRKVGSQLRVTVQLIDVSRGYQVWSGRYDRQTADVLAMQEEIARNIVRALRGTLAPGSTNGVLRAHSSDVQAYDLYLRGRMLFYQLTRRSLEFGRDMFLKATQIDPAYALAYAGAADCSSFLCMWFDRGPENLQAADANSRWAVELAPELAEAHASRGLALALNRKYDEAEREFEAAIRLDPGLFEAYYFYARDSAARGRLEKAAELFRRANQARPEDYQSLFLGAQALRGLGRGEEARRMALRGITTAERHLDLYPEDTRALYLGSAALVISGQKERGLEWARRAAELDPEQDGMLYQLACIHSLAGELDQAVGFLERWEQEGALPRDWLEHDSDLDPLRDHPRFAALMARLP